MDTSKLKRFAPECREQLIEQVGVKLDYVLTTRTPDLAAQENLVKALQKAIEGEGRDAVIERVAYTWFNRLAALRYLDARGWHPFRLRVLTPANEDDTQPELLRQVRQGVIPDELQDFVSAQRVNDLLDGKLPSANPQAEVQRLLVIGVCQYYAFLLPDLFERLDDFSRLLLPDDLLTEHSAVHGFRTEISDEDCAEVEVLGWLYQFYISEKKDAVMARKKAVPSEDIPAVTQLFTPHWIVRYLVENSLGRLWLRSRPDSRLREHMPYYVEDPAPEPPVWQPEWRSEGLEAMDGDYRSLMWLRPNPALNKDYYENLGYPLTIDGHAYARDKWGLDTAGGEAAAKLEEFEAAGWDQASFEDLRFCLFLVQRGIKWSDDRDKSLLKKYEQIYEAVCQVWDREWKEHEDLVPDLVRQGIRLSGSGQTDSLTVATPEEIRLLDPACGSGHMLTYAFDLLVKIYEEEGHAASEIPEKILTHNLFGLEICPRAAQLAQFALVCKAREQSRAAFRRPVQPQVMCLCDVVLTPEDMQAWSAATGVKLSQDELAQIHQFRENTETFGSLIQPVLDGEKLAALVAKIGEQAPAGDLLVQNTHRKLRLVLDQAEMLSQRYQVVVANPPYMGGKHMTPVLKTWATSHFPNSKVDAFAMFIERCLSLLVTDGFVGMITMQSWMFLSTFEPLRVALLTKSTISSMAHLGPRGFDTIGGEIVQTTAFVLIRANYLDRPGSYLRLIEGRSEHEKAQEFLRIVNEYPDKIFRVPCSRFTPLPGKLFIYWAANSALALFESCDGLGDHAKVGKGLDTGDNDRFLRYWHEIGRPSSRWMPCMKGGEFRKWFGNHDVVIKWENDGEEIKSFEKSNLRNASHYLREGITWTRVATTTTAFRRFGEGCIFESTGPCVFPHDLSLEIVLGYLNSKVASYFLGLIAPTMDFQSGHVSALPIADNFRSLETEESDVKNVVTLATRDWDNFETSWDFRDLPLLRSGDWEVEPGQPGGPWKGRTLAESWDHYAAYCTAAIRHMQELETENNRLWIAAYGLQDELTPEVPEKEITLARADPKKDMAAFLSYAIGCMMGRYSLDAPGLILANAGDTVDDYLQIVNELWGELPVVDETGVLWEEIAFLPDNDGIIPITEDDWFEDDAASRVREFLRVTFGPETLEENVTFLEESLGKDLRKYFTANAGGFYADHVKTYKKRPIYWLFESPKKHFHALVYLHRYTKDTVNTLLNGYLREFHHKLTAKIDDLQYVVNSADASAKEKNAAQKQIDQAQAALRDVEQYERDILLPLAQQRLEIDLDDGVKTNYPKFGKALAKVAGLS